MEPLSERNPTVTVVVPNYNHARYLPERLASIFRQTYRDYELIVLDDASTDDSREVLQPYADRGEIELIVNAQNSGSPFAQWACGAARARGEYLWIAESDDSADPHLLERLVAVLGAYPRVGLAYCQSRRMDAAGHAGESCEEWNRNLHPTRWKSDYVNDGRDEVARFLAIQNTVPNASGVLLRTAALRRAVAGAGAYRLSGDWRTWINLLLEADVAFVADCLNLFRIHDRSVRDTTKSSLACAEYLAVKAHACQQAHAAASVRRRSFDEEYAQWSRCLNAEGLKSRLPWVARTVRDGFRIRTAGGLRMLGGLLVTLLKRTFWHRLVKGSAAK